MVETVSSVSVPQHTLIARIFPSPDYADAYRVALPGTGPHDLDTVARVAIGAAPLWVRLLMRLRDRVVRLVGIQPSGASQVSAKRITHDRVGIFPVLARTDDELLLGANDHHLDFCLSLLLERDADRTWLVVATVVRFNNWLGRAYFLPVQPLHRLIVPAMIRHGLRRYRRP